MKYMILKAGKTLHRRNADGSMEPIPHGKWVAVFGDETSHDPRKLLGPFETKQEAADAVEEET